jgi:hypothetical protein
MIMVAVNIQDPHPKMNPFLLDFDLEYPPV